MLITNIFTCVFSLNDFSAKSPNDHQFIIGSLCARGAAFIHSTLNPFANNKQLSSNNYQFKTVCCFSLLFAILSSPFIHFFFAFCFVWLLGYAQDYFFPWKKQFYIITFRAFIYRCYNTGNITSWRMRYRVILFTLFALFREKITQKYHKRIISAGISTQFLRKWYISPILFAARNTIQLQLRSSFWLEQNNTLSLHGLFKKKRKRKEKWF